MSQLELPFTPYSGGNTSYYLTTTSAWVCEGDAAVQHIMQLTSDMQLTVASDIETQGLERFNVRCVTFAYRTPGGKILGLFLDPRIPSHREAARHMFAIAKEIIFHNATFDVPPLVYYNLMHADHVYKVFDTLVLARMFETDIKGTRSLEQLARRFVPSIEDTRYQIREAFKAMGYSTTAGGYESAGTTYPVWRTGAVADTVATLLLKDPLYEAVKQEQLQFAYLQPSYWAQGELTPEQQFDWLVAREQTTNQVMLRSSARGIAVDFEYLERYTAAHDAEMNASRRILEAEGLDPDSGKISALLVQRLYDKGELPAGWERTKTGQLASDKKSLQRLEGNPLAQAAVTVKEMAKIKVYLQKVGSMAAKTGRIYPQVAVLGAHATGRMSYSDPELQQFPSGARPILIADPGAELTSIDWSSIEPVVIGNLAGDEDFLRGFNSGGDLYIAPAKVAGLIPHDLDDEHALHHPGRKQAKVVVLANTYGQGKALLASNLGVSVQEAVNIKQQYNQAMAKTVEFLDRVRRFASQQGFIRTVDGRGLRVPRDAEGSFMGYKAMNYITQGSAYSLLSETLNLVHANGLDDAVRLAMHDELVVDSEAAFEIRKLMETSPIWLTRAAGHPVLLRTDANNMGQSWQYV